LFDEESGGLVTYWKTISAITSRIGTGTSMRATADVAREKWTGQFLVYTRGTGGTVFNNHRGPTGARISLVHVYAWGDSRTDADALIEAVKLAMQSGFARNTWSGVYINRCLIDEPPDDGHDPPFDGSDKKKFWSRLVLRITHAEGGGT